MLARRLIAIAAAVAALVFVYQRQSQAQAASAVPAQKAPAAESDAPAPVKAPHYGDVLFRFFQQDWFGSATTLMVSQHFTRLTPHDDESEVLRGGLLLSWGLHREAGEVFARLIDTTTKPSVRDRAWYFLAKIRWQRGLPGEADAALAQVAAPLTVPALQEDRLLLQAQLAMARGDHAAAAAVLDAMQRDPKISTLAQGYARFNLGVALVKAGDTAAGAAMLERIGSTSMASEEERALRDRANVALGFAALQASDPQAARAALQRVRLNGAHANKALLGFGWAAAELKEPQRALVPWDELAGRDPGDAAVLEARIAVPYALAELGAEGQALARYEEAAAFYGSERARLAETIAAVRDGRMVNALFELNPTRAGEAMGWFASLSKLPAMPHARHLAPLLSGHEFQEAFKNLRDLRFVDANLKSWQDNLVVFDHMLAERRAAFTERLPKVRARPEGSGIAALAARRDAVAAELARAESENDTEALAPAERRQALETVARARATIEKASAATEDVGDLKEAAERLRRVQGALTWALAQDHPARLWEAKKALRATDTALAQATERDAALERAQQEEPQRFEAFAARIARLSQRLAALQPRVVALATEQQAALQGIAVAELQRQQERLDVYATQAQLAIAQLLDRAQVAQRARPEGGPR
jgi:hypothetical protein